jgi:hypothetical protein
MSDIQWVGPGEYSSPYYENFSSNPYTLTSNSYRVDFEYRESVVNEFNQPVYLIARTYGATDTLFNENPRLRVIANVSGSGSTADNELVISTIENITGFQSILATFGISGGGQFDRPIEPISFNEDLVDITTTYPYQMTFYLENEFMFITSEDLQATENSFHQINFDIQLAPYRKWNIGKINV